MMEERYVQEGVSGDGGVKSTRRVSIEDARTQNTPGGQDRGRLLGILIPRDAKKVKCGE